MKEDYRRVFTLLAAAAVVVAYLSTSYSQSVGTAYFLLLVICAAVFWRPPKTQAQVLFLAVAFASLWLHINSDQKTEGLAGVIGAMILYLNTKKK